MNATSCKVTVLRQSTVAADIRCLTVQWPDASRPAKAGQFFMLRAWAANETPILSRPISVHDFDAATGALTFLYQVKGEGTQKLAALKEGDTLTVTGPCGNGFDVAAIARAAGGKNGKIAFVGENELAQTTMFKILMGELEPDEGSVKWGQTVTTSYLPKDNSEYFDGHTESLVDWIRQYSAKKDDVYLRGFLGRMLFSGDDVFKPVNVLSGGEKVRCMLSRMMLSGANVVLLDQPTNHLDMESIQAVNKGLMAFPGNVLLASHDHEMLQTTCNRVIEFQPDGTILDRPGTYDEYLDWKRERLAQ